VAHKEFILQGFTSRTHGDAIRELFDVPNIKRVLLSVAFITESGVQQIGEKLHAHAKGLTVFAGISTHQGLKLLHSYGGDLYAVDTGARHTVFHPKLYLVRGKQLARAIVGSANLTLGGLNNNIEAGMLLEFDLSKPNDKAFVDKIETGFDGLSADYPENVIKVSEEKLLDEWLSSGRLIDEMAVPPPRPSSSTGGAAGTSDVVPRIKLKVVTLRRALKKAKAAPKKSAAKKAPTVATKVAGAILLPPPAPASIGVDLELVWESKALTRRDLTIPNVTGTNPTGSINLDKGLLPAEVDHRHYFRESVFSALTWSATTASGAVEETFAKFQLVLKGVSYGEFDLRIAHTTSTTSTTYEQNNAMTRLSWGPMRPYVARADLIDRNLALYRDEVDPTRFVLEID
jgi:HKD family nuclease